jgi:GDP-mannose 6-dehydrogenase
MLASILPSNQSHLGLALRKILATGKRRIGFLGLSFKAGTDDLRESPLVTLAEQLIGKGMSLAVYDPDVHLSSLLGANRRYIDLHMPHIGELLQADLKAVISNCDVLVVALASADVRAALELLCRPEQVVLDLVNLPNRAALAATVQGLAW